MYGKGKLSNYQVKKKFVKSVLHKLDFYFNSINSLDISLKIASIA